jgi:hypothetical protein
MVMAAGSNASLAPQAMQVLLSKNMLCPQRQRKTLIAAA